MNPDLQAFVREALARGIPRSAIADKLREAGWPPEEIEAGLAAWAEVDFPLPVPRRRPYLSAREAFLYLVLFATLYTTAFNVGVVLFQLIDRWMPVLGRPNENPAFAAELIRGATAGLVIAFPIFLMVSTNIGRAIRREPDKRGSKIRKWLTYVTLFIAAMVLIGDLTFLVSRLLAGEIVARVLLKVLVVFAIAGVVFSHYLGELRRDEREGLAPAGELRVSPRLVAAVVALVIVAGLVASGSPRRERLRQLDAQRIEDLQRISRKVTAWSFDHQRLPQSLEELRADPEAVGMRFHDPVTRSLYEYRVQDSLSYELCATFVTADSLAPSGDPAEASHFWKHAPERTCFRLTIPARNLRHEGGAPGSAPGRP